MEIQTLPLLIKSDMIPLDYSCNHINEIYEFIYVIFFFFFTIIISSSINMLFMALLEMV